jgi:hypothetical protein
VHVRCDPWHRGQRRATFRLASRFLLVDCAGVNIKRCAAAGMTHQFLSDLYVDTERSQIHRERMTKTVPTYLLSDDSDPRSLCLVFPNRLRTQERRTLTSTELRLLSESNLYGRKARMCESIKKVQ